MILIRCNLHGYPCMYANVNLVTSSLYFSKSDGQVEGLLVYVKTYLRKINIVEKLSYL